MKKIKSYAALGDNVIIAIVTTYPDTGLIMTDAQNSTRKDMTIKVIVKDIGATVPKEYGIKTGDTVILAQHAQMEGMMKIKEEKRGASGSIRTDQAIINYQYLVAKEIYLK